MGIFALIAGAAIFYSTISAAIYSPTSLSFSTIKDIVLLWIAIYGGYQTIKLRFIGQKLLLVFYSYQIIPAVIFIFKIAWAIATGSINKLWLDPSWQRSFIITTSYFLFCISSLILLLRKNISGNFQPENNFHHMETVGKILSLVAPGLGRALVGSNWIGIILFYAYFSLFTGVIDIGWGGWALPGLLFDSFVKFLIWSSFFEIDWTFVKNATKIHASVLQTPVTAISVESAE
jgi:hypothetical protein